MWWRELVSAQDLTIRRARPQDAGALARVQVDSWREAYHGLIPQDYLDRLSYDAHERQWRRALANYGAVFLAVSHGQIVGLASGGRCRSLKGYRGELYVLYLLHAHHGHGIGRALFDAVHYHLAQQGFGDLLVWVLADNPARGFYEHLGGTAVGEASCLIGGARLKEVAYAWWG